MAHELVEQPTHQQSLSIEHGRADIIGDIVSVDLPLGVVDVVVEYEHVMNDRDRFLWQWIHRLFDAFTLSCVPQHELAEVKEIKTLFTVFITTLDDLVESRRDTETFQEACRVATAPQTVDATRPGVDESVIAFVEMVWERIDERLRAAPRYDEFRHILAYDIRQAFNAMDYTRLVSDHKHMANCAEARTYGAHNMVLFSYVDIDLMFSPTFALEDLSELRDLTADLQKMARIGNWVTTWERELTEGDYSAGVIVQALEEGVVAPEELDPANDELGVVAERIKERGIEDAFMDEWNARHAAVVGREYGMKSVDPHRFIRGMETVMEYHLASRGMK